MAMDIIMFCLINTFLFFVGVIFADFIASEFKIRKINKKLKAYRNEEIKDFSVKMKSLQDD